MQELLLRERDHAGALRLVDERAQLLGGGDRLAGADVADAERAQDERRRLLQQPDDRRQELPDDLDRRRDEDGELAARSRARALGTSSPSTTLRYVTIVKPTT